MPLLPPNADITDDHRMMIDAVREYAAGELPALDRKWDTEDSSVIEVLPQLAEMGLLALCLPEELNGVACPSRVYAAIIHEIAVYSPSVAVTIAVHNMVGNNLSKFVSGSLRDEVLMRWCDPGNFAAFCLSEAGAGSDAAATKTTAARVDGGYRVRGEKMWVSNGMDARWFLSLVRTGDASEQEDLTALLIDGDEPGLERSRITGKMGLRGSDTAVIHLNDVFVPDEHVIGDPGSGLQVFLASLNEGRIGIAAQATGIAEACLSEMVSYARQREQFGRLIGKFQAVANMIADSAVELEASKALVWRAAGLVDSGRSDRAASSMAKLYASESANRIAYRAVQVHGGAGYVNECRVEQLYRDVRVTTIYEGTSEVQRIVIARGLG